MRVLMLVNWKVEYAKKKPIDKQSPDYVWDKEKYWFFKYFPEDVCVDVVDIGKSVFWEKFEKNIIRFYIRQTLKCIPKLNQYDLVLSHGMQSGIVLCLWRKLFGKGKYKHIVFDIGAFNSARETGKALKLMQFASKSLDGVIYHTRTQKKYYEKCFPWLLTKSQYIAFGTDPEYFTPHAGEIKNEEDYILCVGYQKRDWDSLIRAYQLFRQKNINGKIPKLRILGNSDIKVESPGVEKMASVPIKEFLNQVKNAAFAVLPLKSFNYSFGQMTLLQQMAMEKTVLAADVPSLHDYMINGKTAITYESENVNDLAKKMEYLWENPQIRERIGKNARKAVVDQWNEKRMAREIWIYIKKVCEI